MRLSIRPAADGERGFCEALNRRNMAGYLAARGIPWDPARFLASWSEFENLVILADGEVVGLLRLAPEQGALGLRDLQVLPQRQGCGIGTWAVRQAQSITVSRGYPRLQLRVYGENPARALYARLGFAMESDSGGTIHMAWAAPADSRPGRLATSTPRAGSRRSIRADAPVVAMSSLTRRSPMDILIRSEAPADVAAIEAVTVAAFLHATHTSHTEQFILAALRRSGQLSVSLVADDGGAIIGHVAVSPVEVPDGAAGWYGLGPLSVAPDRQGRGVGSRLVERALDELRGRGAAGCVVLGEPGYYARFGFVAEPSMVLPGVPPEYFQAIAFSGPLPAGEVSYHASFAATG